MEDKIKLLLRGRERESVWRIKSGSVMLPAGEREVQAEEKRALAFL